MRKGSLNPRGAPRYSRVFARGGDAGSRGSALTASRLARRFRIVVVKQDIFGSAIEIVVLT